MEMSKDFFTGRQVLQKGTKTNIITGQREKDQLFQRLIFHLLSRGYKYFCACVYKEESDSAIYLNCPFEKRVAFNGLL